MQALRLGQENGILLPDTLIVSTHEAMHQKAQAMQKIMADIYHWRFDICRADCLKDDRRYRWFLASRRNSGMHMRDCGHGFFEVCAMRWDWIVASLSVTQPVNEY